jgi:hypothetical protein
MLPETYKIKEINIGNISRIFYYENDPIRQEHAISAYERLDEIAQKHSFFAPGFVAGPDLVENTYKEIIISNPTDEYEYLRSPLIAIPVTKNKITTVLYHHYYFEEGLAGYPPSTLLLCWPPFCGITDEKYVYKVISPTLLSFIEACLNTKRVMGSTQDFKSYAYLLLYHYLEHCIVFDQYTTYEQKGLELDRGDLLLPTYVYGISASTLGHQLLSGVIPYLLTEFSEKGVDYLSLKTQEGDISLAQDSKILTKSLKFLVENEHSIHQEVFSKLIRTPHSRGPSFEDSFQSIQPTLSYLKDKLC